MTFCTFHLLSVLILFETIELSFRTITIFIFKNEINFLQGFQFDVHQFKCKLSKYKQRGSLVKFLNISETLTAKGAQLGILISQIGVRKIKQ